MEAYGPTSPYSSSFICVIAIVNISEFQLQF